MEKKGTPLEPDDGPMIAKLLLSGWDVSFYVKPADPIIFAEGQSFVTQCLLLLVPIREPASSSPSPMEASVHATMPVTAFLSEIDAGGKAMRNTFAEKCASVAWETLIRRAPGTLRHGPEANGGGPGEWADAG